MSVMKNIKKTASKAFNKAKAFDQKLDQTMIGGAINGGLGKINRGTDKVLGKVFNNPNRAISISVNAGVGAAAVAIAATAGGILWPAVAASAAALEVYNVGRDVNDWRKARAAKKNPPSSGPSA